MARRFKAAVIGGSGYGANEMLRRLVLHPQVEIARVSSIELVGKPVWSAHPNLTGLPALEGLVFEDIPPSARPRRGATSPCWRCRTRSRPPRSRSSWRSA
jgi:hypothetical protein